jgi:hypothetical protein
MTLTLDAKVKAVFDLPNEKKSFATRLTQAMMVQLDTASLDDVRALLVDIERFSGRNSDDPNSYGKAPSAIFKAIFTFAHAITDPTKNPTKEEISQTAFHIRSNLNVGRSQYQSTKKEAAMELPKTVDEAKALSDSDTETLRQQALVGLEQVQLANIRTRGA